LPSTLARPVQKYALSSSSTNANWDDWAPLSKEDYAIEKQRLIDTTIDALEKYVPDVREKIDHVEASTPITFHHYTQQMNGATFGTKFEGLKVSMDLPKQIPGLFHAGSVGIIMSGWLGAINYGVIVANEVDSFLCSEETQIKTIVKSKALDKPQQVTPTVPINRVAS